MGTLEPISSISDSSTSMTIELEGSTILTESSLSLPLLLSAAAVTGFSANGWIFSPSESLSASSLINLTALPQSFNPSHVTCSCCQADDSGETFTDVEPAVSSCFRESTEVVWAAKHDVSSSGGNKSEGRRCTGWFTGTCGVSGLQRRVGAWQISCFTGMVGRERGWLVKGAGFESGSFWLDVGGRTVEEERGDSLDCMTAATPADEVAALPALCCPEYPPGGGEERKG